MRRIARIARFLINRPNAPERGHFGVIAHTTQIGHNATPLAMPREGGYDRCMMNRIPALTPDALAAAIIAYLAPADADTLRNDIEFLAEGDIAHFAYLAIRDLRDLDAEPFQIFDFDEIITKGGEMLNSDMMHEMLQTAIKRWIA